jgi:hypothetical protein
MMRAAKYGLLLLSQLGRSSAETGYNLTDVEHQISAFIDQNAGHEARSLGKIGCAVAVRKHDPRSVAFRDGPRN